MPSVAIIYEAAAAPTADRMLHQRVSGDVHIFVARNASEVLEIAGGLGSEGIDIIELCGGISPSYRPKVAAAVGPGVFVSSVTFGIESLDAAAAFINAWTLRTPPREAFLILDETADPLRNRFRRSYPPQDTSFIPCPADMAPGVAVSLVQDGVGLIELYGGFSSRDAGLIIDAVGGRAAVGVGSLTLDGAHVAAL